MGFPFCLTRVGYLSITFLSISCLLLGFFANPVDSGALEPKSEHDCSALKHFLDYKSKCAYLKSIDRCANQGFVDYLSFLYCKFDGFPVLGLFLLFLWLLLLFYMLGHTASEYFCSSLESLSKLLNLSPTVAGVTLLSLGNGAPDLFASLVSFMGESKGATTKKSNPPKKWLLLWLGGGFIMSMTWSYISAQELVALLTSLGYIFGVSPSILGLTVLAWGNSIGDLITNLTMALHDGDEGAQVAISGCYAGPIFNTLFSLGISLVGCAWEVYPSSVVIKTDPRLLESLGFVVIGLVWSFLVLFSNRMRLSGSIGIGLLVIYLASLSLRVIQTVGDSH